MFEKTNRITAKRVGRAAVEAQAGDFTLRVDEPKGAGGEGTGMSPVEDLLCSLGACELVAATIFARQMRIELEEISIEVEGDMDSAGQMGYTGIRPGYQDIRLVYHIKTDAPPAKVQALIDLVEQRCPVADSLKNGVPIGKPKVVLEY